MKLFVLTLAIVVTAFSVGCGSEDEETQDEAVEVDVDPKSPDVMPTTMGKRSEVKDAHDR